MCDLNGLIHAKHGRDRLNHYLAQMWSRDNGGHEVCQLTDLDIKNADRLFTMESSNGISPNKFPPGHKIVRHLKTKGEIVKAAKQQQS